MSVNIETDISSANITKSYQFTIFESHEERLKAICEHYKFGGGVIYDPKIQTNIWFNIIGPEYSNIINCPRRMWGNKPL